MAARIIHSLRKTYRLADILAAIKFPKATYMYWQKRFNRDNKDTDIERKLLRLRDKHPNYGYRRLWATLRAEGIVINKKKVQRIVQKLNLQVKSFTRKSRKYSSYKGTVGRIAPNRVNRRFKTIIPYQKITTDTSEFKYYEPDECGNLAIKKLYLALFMDLFNLEFISFRLSPHPSAESILSALDEAIEITEACPYRRTFHSDRGWAYQMHSYRSRLKANSIYQSMSRKGNCLDNSPMENFFGILKQEIYYGRVFHSYQELADAIEEFIKYYNQERIKESLNWMSPIQFRNAV